jgi:hypothetical protein
MAGSISCCYVCRFVETRTSCVVNNMVNSAKCKQICSNL